MLLANVSVSNQSGQKEEQPHLVVLGSHTLKQEPVGWWSCSMLNILKYARLPSNFAVHTTGSRKRVFVLIGRRGFERDSAPASAAAV